MNDAWEYRKNLARVGTNCKHGIWWSTDCADCAKEPDQRPAQWPPMPK